jgi:hypothetical protein
MPIAQIGERSYEAVARRGLGNEPRRLAGRCPRIETPESARHRIAPSTASHRVQPF